MGLPLVLSPDPLYAPLKWNLCQLHGPSLKLLLLLLLLLVLALSPLVPTQETILLNCRGPLTIIAYFEHIINIYVFVISYNITPDHKYCLLIHHLVAMTLVRHSCQLDFDAPQMLQRISREWHQLLFHYLIYCPPRG